MEDNNGKGKTRERIGVYVCHCGSNIAGVVDCPAVAEYARSLPDVVLARDYKYMCSDPGQTLIKDDIKEHGLTRVVVASCSPRMHEPTFRRACEQAGLNAYLFEMANIREHCSWVTDDKAKATEKAKALVSAAVRRVVWQQPLQTREVPVTPAAMVIGGGVAGIQAALEIADAGFKVYMVERDPSIGGHMAQLDKTFPTLDCSACILTPKMVSVSQHPNIELLAYSEVVDVQGYVGNFKVKVKKKARYVDEEKCRGCGICEEKCPGRVPSEFEEGLGKRKAIYRPFPQAVPNIPVLDRDNCLYFQRGRCRVCERFCDSNAIDYEQEDRFVDLDVGAIVLATGYDLFDASADMRYGYRRLDNVISALEFERMCNASGPTAGRILMANGKEPKSVAIIHCVGSRDTNYHQYCSRVCCMYSMKFAHLVKDRVGHDTKVFEFYTDLRAFGKGYEEFYNRVQEEGVTFVRGRPAEVTDVPETIDEVGKLIVQAENTLVSRQVRIPVDMVVLSGGLEPRSDTAEVARMFNISRSQDGFFLERHPKLDPVASMTDGVFVAGCCQGPKDIPDTVAQAAAAAVRAVGLMNKGKIQVEAATSMVQAELCSGCRVCNKLCPYSAITFDEEKKVSVINDAVCKGCGVCAAACPSDAIVSRHFTDAQILAEIEGVLV
ncbi:MAG: CoB--CoM heterodisulfide reductase iron-sulfur subunit A family protein [Bacteroidetes bacterium]|nr:CoB--CoM heterodisulfide reductase iron-sulfur subunit A family protein [Bacteroidota bacterium]